MYYVLYSPFLVPESYTLSPSYKIPTHRDTIKEYLIVYKLRKLQIIWHAFFVGEHVCTAASRALSVCVTSICEGAQSSDGSVHDTLIRSVHYTLIRSVHYTLIRSDGSVHYTLIRSLGSVHYTLIYMVSRLSTLYTHTASRVTYTDEYRACIWTIFGEFRYERSKSVYVILLTV